MYKNHAVGFISPYQSHFSNKQNKQRRLSLLAKLQAKRYRVFSVEGVHLESHRSPDQKEIGKDIFFVVDQKDTGRLRDNLQLIGILFDQDSILFIPEIGENGFLIGTSGRPNTWPGLGKVISLNGMRSGDFFINIKNHPFIFGISPVLKEYKLPEGFMGRMSCHRMAKLKWWEIPS